MTEQYQQLNINLLPDGETFQGSLAANTPIPGAALTALPLTVETITSPLIFHPAGSSDLTFLANGRVVIQWAVSIGNLTLLARTQSETLLLLDAGAGFIPFSGPIGFGYHRNFAEGNGTTTGQHQFSVSQNDVIRIASMRISGVGALQFVGLACEVLVRFVPDI